MGKCIETYYDESGCVVQRMYQGAKMVIAIRAMIQVNASVEVPFDFTTQDEVEISFKKKISQTDRLLFKKDLDNGIVIDEEDTAKIFVTIDKEDTEGCCANLVGTLSTKKGGFREDLLNLRLDIYPITNKI